MSDNGTILFLFVAKPIRTNYDFFLLVCFYSPFELCSAVSNPSAPWWSIVIMGLSAWYHFIWNLRSFPTPVYLLLPLRGSPWNFVTADSQELEWWANTQSGILRHRRIPFIWPGWIPGPRSTSTWCHCAWTWWMVNTYQGRKHQKADGQLEKTAGPTSKRLAHVQHDAIAIPLSSVYAVEIRDTEFLHRVHWSEIARGTERRNGPLGLYVTIMTML